MDCKTIRTASFLYRESREKIQYFLRVGGGCFYKSVERIFINQWERIFINRLTEEYCTHIIKHMLHN